MADMKERNSSKEDGFGQRQQILFFIATKAARISDAMVTYFNEQVCIEIYCGQNCWESRLGERGGGGKVLL